MRASEIPNKSAADLHFTLARAHSMRISSLRGSGLMLALASLVLTLPAQYVGKVTQDTKQNPILRSVAVLEWTGEEGKPTASRLVPITVLDGGQLQDGGVYLARPQPMALGAEVEYELQQQGKPLGLFDVKNAGQMEGSWVGFGAWKPLPVAKPKAPAKLSAEDFDDTQSDTPVLHRKHHADDSGSKTKSDDSSSSAPAASDDPDRPTLHKKTDSGSTDSSTKSDSKSDPRPDPAQPTLHKKSDSDDTTATVDSDPDRPTLHRPKTAAPPPSSDEASSSETDPDRPRLKRGVPTGYDLKLTPSLVGFPPDVQQTVAISDAATRPAHPWQYAWANPEDEAKMKAALEAIAREALGLNAPAAPAKPAARTSATGTRASATRRSAKSTATPAAPAPLEDEQFRVFELAYGSGATLVLSAHTGGHGAAEKFVTIVAQPDLYGNALVLLKNVTDGAHLDQTPRMRLVDAVDAMADNRGELLFELRGATSRQFVLYRVLRGRAEKLFATGSSDIGEVGTTSFLEPGLAFPK